NSTLRAALALGDGPLSSCGFVSRRVLSLVQETLPALAGNRSRIAAVLVLLAVFGVGLAGAVLSLPPPEGPPAGHQSFDPAADPARLPGPRSARLKERVAGGLDWLVGVQDNTGAWGIGNYDSWIDESATAGMALLAEGSTPSRGRYAPALQKLLDYYVPPPRADGGGGPSRADLLLIRKNSSTLFL